MKRMKSICEKASDLVSSNLDSLLVEQSRTGLVDIKAIQEHVNCILDLQKAIAENRKQLNLYPIGESDV
jgi:hypothetical protein